MLIQLIPAGQTSLIEYEQTNELCDGHVVYRETLDTGAQQTAERKSTQSNGKNGRAYLVNDAMQCKELEKVGIGPARNGAQCKRAKWIRARAVQ